MSDEDIKAVVRWQQTRPCASFCSYAIEAQMAGDALAAEVARLRAERNRLADALRPFAHMAKTGEEFRMSDLLAAQEALEGIDDGT